MKLLAERKDIMFNGRAIHNTNNNNNNDTNQKIPSQTVRLLARKTDIMYNIRTKNNTNNNMKVLQFKSNYAVIN